MAKKLADVEVIHGAVGAAEVADAVLALSSLSHVDYVDDFTLAHAAGDATPEEWARAIFGDVPDIAEKVIWRGILGLRLSRGPSPATVAGWRIADQGEGWIRLEAASWFVSGNLIVRASRTHVSLATFMRYDRWLARVVCPLLTLVHRALVPGVLRDGAQMVPARGHHHVGDINQ